MFATYSNKKDYILLLKADEFLRDRSILAAARHFPGMVCGMSTVPALNRVRHFDDVLCGDPHRPESALKAVKEFEITTGLKPKAVIPITEMTLMSAELIARHYELPFLSSECVAASRNKILMKQAFQMNKVPTAKYFPFSSKEELLIAADKIGYPVIVKPVEAAHSIGVKKISSIYEIDEAYQYCEESLKSISEQWGIGNGKFQVEEFIDAEKEISVEIVNIHGQHHIIAITDKFLTPPPFFAEIGHKVPSTETDNQLVRNAAVNACQALGLNFGVSHVEIRIDKAGNPYVIEVASRPGGDGIMDLVERAYGINLYELHIRSYLGTLSEADLQNINFMGTAAIAFMPALRGKVQAIEIPSQLPREVKSLYLNAQVGDTVGESLNYDDRLGTVEFFWQGIDNRENTHLTLAESLRDKIYSIS